MVVEHIQYTDTLRQGTDKINAAIDQSNEAIEKATTADANASQALATANNVQTQLNTIVIEGDSSVEAAQARVDADGNVFSTLKERLDTKDTQFQQSINNLRQRVLTVQDFGAVGDGMTDDTSAFNDAITAAVTSGIGTVIVPPGMYLIDASVGVTLQSNVTLILQPGVILQAIPNALEGYQVLRISDVENVTVVGYGAIIRGERDEHTGTIGDWGHCIGVYGATNIQIFGVKCEKAWGDGIEIGPSANKQFCENVQIVDVHCDQNRRQGISLLSGRNIEIVRSKLTNTNGVYPQRGIDIEPFDSSHYIENIRLINLYTENNAGGGVLIYLDALSGTDRKVSITIQNHYSYRDGSAAMHIGAVRGVLSGYITIERPFWCETKRGVFVVENYASVGPVVQVIEPKLIDVNTEDGSAENFHSAFIIKREIGDSGTLPMGNVHVIRPIISTTGQYRPVNVLFCRDYVAGAVIEKVSLIDPIEVVSKKTPLWIPAKGIISDQYRTMVYEPDFDFMLDFWNHRPVVTNRNFTAARTITLSDYYVKDSPELTFEVHSNQPLRIQTQPTDKIVPLTNEPGKIIQSNVIGSRIKLKKLDDTSWFVMEMVGVWTVQ